MKLIVAGSRQLNVLAMIDGLLTHFGLEPTEIVCGEAAGPDRDGKEWAKANGVSVKSFPANWGSANMRARMIALKKPFYEVILKRPL
jgi:hypothetical protein